MEHYDDNLATEKLAALAHPARLAIIRMLVRAGPAGMPAGKLGEPLGMAANALTFHLQKLARVGLVTSRRSGQYILYTAEFDTLLNLTGYLVGACCTDSSEKCGGCPSAD
ncbi:transcriptional regulator [Marinobacter halodurans]|uniref:Transcriptional regulator n=1 Tax=Marinobacter halodurans TaxID=2528979 RepID=A0ABY1ZSG8_9GAMM|nr:metalloregulator ArsR/SmtB family transcription factor [Marinobacter halodurans]TBW59026.1 transcriptional regulator [Marinobacter halodurans]